MENESEKMISSGRLQSLAWSLAEIYFRYTQHRDKTIAPRSRGRTRTRGFREDVMARPTGECLGQHDVFGEAHLRQDPGWLCRVL